MKNLLLSVVQNRISLVMLSEAKSKQLLCAGTTQCLMNAMQTGGRNAVLAGDSSLRSE